MEGKGREIRERKNVFEKCLNLQTDKTKKGK